MTLDDIELTTAARWRKLSLAVFGIGGMLAAQIMSGTPVSVPLVAGVCVVFLGFACSDVLDKALQSGAIGKLADMIPGAKK